MPLPRRGSEPSLIYLSVRMMHACVFVCATSASWGRSNENVDFDDSSPRPPPVDLPHGRLPVLLVVDPFGLVGGMDHDDGGIPGGRERRRQVLVGTTGEELVGMPIDGGRAQILARGFVLDVDAVRQVGVSGHLDAEGRLARRRFGLAGLPFVALDLAHQDVEEDQTVGASFLRAHRGNL